MNLVQYFLGIYIIIIVFFGLDYCLQGKGKRGIRFIIYVGTQIFLGIFTNFLGEDYGIIIGVAGIIITYSFVIFFHKDSPIKSTMCYLLMDTLLGVPISLGILLVNLIYYHGRPFAVVPVNYREMVIVIAVSLCIILLLKRIGFLEKVLNWFRSIKEIPISIGVIFIPFYLSALFLNRATQFQRTMSGFLLPMVFFILIWYGLFFWISYLDKVTLEQNNKYFKKQKKIQELHYTSLKRQIEETKKMQQYILEQSEVIEILLDQNDIKEVKKYGKALQNCYYDLELKEYTSSQVINFTIANQIKECERKKIKTEFLLNNLPLIKFENESIFMLLVLNVFHFVINENMREKEFRKRYISIKDEWQDNKYQISISYLELKKDKGTKIKS